MKNCVIVCLRIPSLNDKYKLLSPCFMEGYLISPSSSVVFVVCSSAACWLKLRWRKATGQLTFIAACSLMPLCCVWAGRALIGQVTVAISRLSVHVANTLSIRFLICKRHYLMCTGFFFFLFLQATSTCLHRLARGGVVWYHSLMRHGKCYLND